eukprot:365351-Chlamydomonas_euryale.AAC.4
MHAPWRHHHTWVTHGLHMATCWSRRLTRGHMLIKTVDTGSRRGLARTSPHLRARVHTCAHESTLVPTSEGSHAWEAPQLQEQMTQSIRRREMSPMAGHLQEEKDATIQRQEVRREMCPKAGHLQEEKDATIQGQEVRREMCPGAGHLQEEKDATIQGQEVRREISPRAGHLQEEKGPWTRDINTLNTQ